jgi:hypothetical protein
MRVSLPWYLWIACLLGYLVVGTIWVLFRWGAWTRSKRRDYENGQEGTHEYNSLLKNCNPREHKALIYNWIILWPVSLITYVFGDLAYDITHDVGRFIYKMIHGSLEAISRRNLSGVRRPSNYHE